MNNNTYTILTESSIQYIAKNILDLAQILNLKIITIESMTGGAIVNTLTNIPGFSDIIYGGLVVYHIDAKTELLNEFNESVYTRQYAEKMCNDALSKYSANIAISITGNSNPTSVSLNDYSAVFYCGIGIRNENNINKDIITISKKFVMNDPITISLKQNDLTRRDFVKKIAIKKALNFLYDTMCNTNTNTNTNTNNNEHGEKNEI